MDSILVGDIRVSHKRRYSVDSRDYIPLSGRAFPHTYRRLVELKISDFIARNWRVCRWCWAALFGLPSAGLVAWIMGVPLFPIGILSLIWDGFRL